jgi:hypothetical protein
MFAKKILIAALVLAGTSLTFVGNASAAPGSLAYDQRLQTVMCPADHSFQECFYGGKHRPAGGA